MTISAILKTAGALAVAATVSLGGVAQASTVAATGEGWCSLNDGCNGPSGVISNTATAENYGANIFRDWFEFNVPNMAITSATLRIWNHESNDGSAGQFDLFGASGISYAGLIDGAILGSVSNAAANSVDNGYVSITLNAAGLAALNGAAGGLFLFGGALTGNDAGDLLFGWTNGNPVAQLDLEVSGGGVPEPATWAMMILGLGGAGAMMRRRRTVAA